MDRRWLVIAALGAMLIASLAAPAPTHARDGDTYWLPKPQTTGGRPLMEALAARKTSRNFTTRKLPRRILSNLLWAAFGINRPDLGKRTAPSARNWQEIDVYVAMAEGLFRYDPKAHVLRLVVRKDLRTATGGQDFLAKAPVSFVYVATLSKMTGAPPEWQKLYATGDTGFIAQNVYLYCASEGLAVVVRGGIPREELAKTLGLGPDHFITFAQTVGYPGE